ncbi:thioredoxin [Fructilactobacillus lindneri]|uniref:Thioredoxin n=2 Tax=Fructilactobacillus lindneri TaxID=53444 RepID=A0A0R2JUX4_9LACO|nr:thioredoxin [Fructilactobacillus lindneri]ANZ58324.1 thiol reductase thioredoxin [Fructilactobacillus lindneri]ANZ59646.1 thiol reductase thioredoxin [Fructilactobacillus lindneri]KRN79157.1 thioredoxin [Fructilactobacillus lindneri DSM 20690 = JCM 11027]POG98570.1 thioredoxin [Fructilactobacillus lindneri]POH03958.1 thioredoxin [Fructilactobacillus lindneri]
MVHEITDADFEKETEKGLVVIDFWAPWCGPCKMQSPVIEELSEEDKDIKFCKLNVDDNQATASKFGIMSIPTLLVKKDGKVVDQIVGYHPKEQLQKLLAEYAA